MSEYKTIVGGKLTLKGGVSLSKKKDEKKKSSKKRKEREGEDHGAAEEYVPTIQLGEGRIISSGTTITGKDTRFMMELSSGDALIVQHPYTLEQETRIITMVLSDVSISISSPFSSDLINGVKFGTLSPPLNLRQSPTISHKCTSTQFMHV